MPCNIKATGTLKETIYKNQFKLITLQNSANNINQKIHCSVWNVCSLNNKLPDVMEHLLDRNTDIAFITETWQKSEKSNVTADVKQYGFTLKHNIRNDPEKERGGGVGIMLKSSFTSVQLAVKKFQSFEHTVVKLSCTGNSVLVLISIYRLQYVSVSTFLDEFPELLETYTVLFDKFIIAGDINIHVETDESSSLRFHEIVELFDLKQHVVGPTHIMGHTIDIVITPNNDSLVENIIITKYDLSHHFLIDFIFNSEAKQTCSRNITYRKIKGIDMQQFQDNVERSFSQLPDTREMNIKVSNFNSIMKQVVDNHAPLKTKSVKIVTRAPWFDAEYATLRRLRRRAEKQYRRTGSQADMDNYVSLRKQTTIMSQSKKKEYISNKLTANSSSKMLYSVVNNLLDSGKETILPTSQSEHKLANDFKSFFTEKISKIRSSIVMSQPRCEPLSTPAENITPLAHFEPATADEIRQIVMSFGIKCSPEDPVPLSLLNNNIDLFIPYWLEIVNLSLESGSMGCLKSAVIIPFIKELGSHVDSDIFKNYRPVSNLVFLSKLVERVVDIRLENHMTSNNLHINNQFGYKKHHSTESLLLKIVDNLLLSCDNNIPSVVLLLDLSAAFDTVDHKKLLEILHHDIGITGTCYEWYKSFLTERTLRVKIGDSYSDENELSYGVAQGSVSGPRLFNIYTRNLYKDVELTKYSIDGFADDHQLLKQFIPKLQGFSLGEDINLCLRRISEWMNDHFLCLNESKTKILIIAPPSIMREIVIGGAFINNNCVRFVDSAKNLGVVLDTHLSFEKQINKVVKSCFIVLRKLSSIKHYLTESHLKILVCSFIFSQIDYCNCLYYKLNASSLKKLQHVQNCAARLVAKRQMRTSLDDVFIKYHWLKVRERILYKIILLVYKCLHLQAPESLSNLLHYAESDRFMRLRETKVNSKFGVRCFSHAGPKLWNLLPNEIRNQHKIDIFKKMLKSYLITNADEFNLKIDMR